MIAQENLLNKLLFGYVKDIHYSAVFSLRLLEPKLRAENSAEQLPESVGDDPAFTLKADPLLAEHPAEQQHTVKAGKTFILIGYIIADLSAYFIGKRHFLPPRTGIRTPKYADA